MQCTVQAALSAVLGFFVIDRYRQRLLLGIFVIDRYRQRLRV